MFPFVFDGRKIAKGRMATGRVVEAFDELKDGHPRLVVRSEAAPIDQLAFEGGEETLAHRSRRRRRPSLSMDERRLPCSERRKRPTCIGRTAIRMMDDVVGLS